MHAKAFPVKVEPRPVFSRLIFISLALGRARENAFFTRPTRWPADNVSVLAKKRESSSEIS